MSNRAADASDPLRIGSVVPLTGPFNASGQQYHFSLQMVQDEINAKGGIAGRKLEIVFADSRDSNAAAVNAFIKLNKELNTPFMFLSSYTTQNLATEPEVTKAALPCVFAGGGDAVHERKNRWMFRIRPYDGLQSQAMSEVLLNDIKSTKPAILYVQNDFGQGVPIPCRNCARRQGLKLLEWKPTASTIRICRPNCYPSRPRALTHSCWYLLATTAL
jgi:branched-chain amino acid transport system substrate-binding protein